MHLWNEILSEKTFDNASLATKIFVYIVSRLAPDRINCKFLIYLFLPASCDLLDSKLNTWRSQWMLQIDILARLKSLKCAIDPSTRCNAMYVSVIGKVDRNFREHSDDINKVPRDFSTQVESVSKIFKIRSLASPSRRSYVHRVNFANEQTDHSDRRVFLPSGPIIIRTICTIILFCLCTNGRLIARS